MTVAQTVQRAVADFVRSGDPTGGRGRGDGPRFPKWGAGLEEVVRGGEEAVARAPVLRLTGQGFLEGRESAAGRCGWFFQTAFAGSN